MKGLLDDDSLNGSFASRITYRPDRRGFPIRTDSTGDFYDAVQYECQIWGGATTALVPVSADGDISALYRRIIAGSTIDHLSGLDHFGLFHLADAKVTLPPSREGWGRQLAVALLEHGKRDDYSTLQVVELDADDPWREIYAACLGRLPDVPDAQVVSAGSLVPTLRFEDLISVDRIVTEGSLQDLLARLSDDSTITPRFLSMAYLSYGHDGSSAIRTEDNALPEPKFARFDAGPNVVVVCSEHNTDDCALLWNLRGAHGDRRPVPIGIPLSEASRENILKIALNP